jgi:DNA helicase HerA-like ATPase
LTACEKRVPTACRSDASRTFFAAEGLVLRALRSVDSDSVAVGTITSNEGSKIVATGLAESAIRSETVVGSLVKMRGPADIVGIVNAIRLDDLNLLRTSLSIDLLGEIDYRSDRGPSFRRGVSCLPVLGCIVEAVTAEDIATVYAQPSVASVQVGGLSGNPSQGAFVMVDELLAKHFAVVGSSGSGKSCTTALILHSILAEEPDAHMVLIDPHNEYEAAFGDLAQHINAENTPLPFWVLDLESAVRVLVKGGTPQEQETQALILEEALLKARKEASGAADTSWITVDTPVPYLVSDLARHLAEGMGMTKNLEQVASYRRLASQLSSLMADRRYSFMFGNDASDTLARDLGNLFRIPVEGKPITILDISGVPMEVADVVVSVLARVLFEFALWADPARRPPILLVCEEAHRYLPSDGGSTFAGCTRAIGRIAREGRKYSLSLALITQRPSELSSQALAQCGTFFVLRLGNELDKRIVTSAIPESGQAMLGSLSSLPAQEAIVFGESVPLPMRVRFNNLPPAQRPRSKSAAFAEAWRLDSTDSAFCDEVVQRWRGGPC